MKFSSLKSQKGFSLVELMIVVGIIGILATLALPRFKQFQAKAKMGEAKNILTHIYTLQQTYSLDNNTYLSFAALGAGLNSVNAGNTCAPDANASALGFRIDPCNANAPVPRYSYSVAAASVTNAAFVAAAVTGANNNNRICPGNAAHYLAIDQTNKIAGAAGAAPNSIAAVNGEPSVGTVCAN